jgi:hypothetical protein
VQINAVSDSTGLRTQALCRPSNGDWKDCTGNLNQIDFISMGLIVDSQGQFVLTGNQVNMKTYRVKANVTARFIGDDWSVETQVPAHDQSYLGAVYEAP